MAGLGNPSEKYSRNRHNAGFMVVDALAQKLGVQFIKEDCPSLAAKAELGQFRIRLLKPLTYMNKSGLAIAPLIEGDCTLIVVHDDLDLPFGSLRVKERGGDGGQGGVRSVIEALGGGNFCRVKVGIGRPPEGVAVADWVLSDFSDSERDALDLVVKRAVEAVLSIVEKGPAWAMNKFNAAPDTSQSETKT